MFRRIFRKIVVVRVQRRSRAKRFGVYAVGPPQYVPLEPLGMYAETVTVSSLLSPAPLGRECVAERVNSSWAMVGCQFVAMQRMARAACRLVCPTQCALRSEIKDLRVVETKVTRLLTLISTPFGVVW